MNSESDNRNISPLSAEMMLERHRSILAEARVFPHVYRIQFLFVIVASWFLASPLIIVRSTATVVATLLMWTWIVKRQSIVYRLLSIEEAIAVAAIDDRKRQWENSYIRFRHESLSSRNITTAEPFMWWALALVSISSRLWQL